jgi:hypothetical protein
MLSLESSLFDIRYKNAILKKKYFENFGLMISYQNQIIIKKQEKNKYYANGFC